MPVCVAAPCEDGKTIVVAADRMKAGQLNTLMPEDTDYVRVKAFGKHVLFLSSCLAVETEKVFARACELSGDPHNTGVEAFAEHVRVAQEEIPTSGRERAKSPSPGNGPDGEVRPWSSEEEFLVVGIDADKPRIYRINEAGRFAIEEHDYAVIGDGERTSWGTLALLRYNPSLPLPHAVYEVYQAKKGGECYVRVGLDTDMAILDAGGIRFLDDSFIRLLEDIRDRQQGPTLGLAGRRLIQRYVPAVLYHGASGPEGAEQVTDAALQSIQGQDVDPDEELAWWEPLMILPTPRGRESAGTPPEPVPCYHFGGPYELTCGVAPEEAEYLDTSYIPRAVGQSSEIKRKVFGHFQCAFYYDCDHAGIMDWARLTHGVLKYLLNPTKVEEVDLPYARDVVVCLSQWSHAERELRSHYRWYMDFVVQKLWGSIERFRDDDGKRLWQPGGDRGDLP